MGRQAVFDYFSQIEEPKKYRVNGQKKWLTESMVTQYVAMYDGNIVTQWELLRPNIAAKYLTNKMTRPDGTFQVLPFQFLKEGTQIEFDVIGVEFSVDPAKRTLSLQVPLPLLAIFLASPAMLMTLRWPLLRRRRKKRGLCLKCGYNLDGNESGVCPECGTEVEKT